MATEKMLAIKAEVEKLVEEYNTLNGTDENGVITAETIKRLAEIESKTAELIKDYAAFSKLEGLTTFAAAEDPLLSLVKALTYEVIRVKDEPIEDSDLTKRVVVPAEKIYDPADLVKFVKDRRLGVAVGKESNWVYQIEKLNTLMTAKKAEDLGIDPKEVNDSINMSKIAREINMGKNPCSNTQFLKTLQGVVAAMIGEEYKAVSHDVNYLKTIYAKKSRKALTVTCANNKQLRQYITEICHRLATGGHYEVEYKKAKAQ